MHQAIDSLDDFDECTEVREIADLAGEARTNGELLVQRAPRIRLHLLETERDLFVFGVDLEDLDVHIVVDGQDLGRMAHIAGPTHLGDVDQTLDALLQLHERPVVDDGDHATGDHRGLRILALDIIPRIGLKLLETQRDPFAITVELEHLDLEFLPDGDQVGRVRDPPPGHIGDMQETVDSAQIDERPKVGDVLDHAFASLTLLQFGQHLVAEILATLFEELTARNDDIAPALVDLDDLELVDLAQDRLDILDRLQIDLGAGQECIDTIEVDDDPTLDAFLQRTFDRLFDIKGALDTVPYANKVRALLG